LGPVPSPTRSRATSPRTRVSHASTTCPAGSSMRRRCPNGATPPRRRLGEAGGGGQRYEKPLWLSVTGENVRRAVGRLRPFPPVGGSNDRAAQRTVAPRLKVSSVPRPEFRRHGSLQVVSI